MAASVSSGATTSTSDGGGERGESRLLDIQPGYHGTSRREGSSVWKLRRGNMADMSLLVVVELSFIVNQYIYKARVLSMYSLVLLSK